MSVPLLTKDLWCHVCGCSTYVLGKFLLDVDCQAKVNQYYIPISHHHHILRLDVSVDIVFAMHVIQSHQKLISNESHRVFIELLTIIEIDCQISCSYQWVKEKVYHILLLLCKM